MSIAGLRRTPGGETACLLPDGMTRVNSSSLLKLGSSGMDEPSLLAGRELVSGLGDVAARLGDGLGDNAAGLGEGAEVFGEGMPVRGEGYCLAGLAAGLSLSSFLRVAEAAALRARLAAVSWRGLLAGLRVEGVSGRNNLL